MIIHTFNTYHFVSCINIILILIYNCYNEDVYLPMELYYLCIDFVFQFIVEKYRNKLNQINNKKSNTPKLVYLVIVTKYTQQNKKVDTFSTPIISYTTSN